MKIGRFAFLKPPLGDLGATYDDHLRLIGKRVVDFLLALIELFSLDLSTVLSQSTRVTDGQTDRQTDRILIARPRLHSMQRGKNEEDVYLSFSLRWKFERVSFRASGQSRGLPRNPIYIVMPKITRTDGFSAENPRQACTCWQRQLRNQTKYEFSRNNSRNDNFTAFPLIPYISDYQNCSVLYRVLKLCTVINLWWRRRRSWWR